MSNPEAILSYQQQPSFQYKRSLTLVIVRYSIMCSGGGELEYKELYRRSAINAKRESWPLTEEWHFNDGYVLRAGVN